MPPDVSLVNRLNVLITHFESKRTTKQQLLAELRSAVGIKQPVPPDYSKEYLALLEQAMKDLGLETRMGNSQLDIELDIHDDINIGVSFGNDNEPTPEDRDLHTWHHSEDARCECPSFQIKCNRNISPADPRSNASEVIKDAIEKLQIDIGRLTKCHKAVVDAKIDGFKEDMWVLKQVANRLNKGVKRGRRV